MTLDRLDTARAALHTDLAAETRKVTWPVARLRQERDARLRSLIRHAMAESPWHARRLAGVDPDTVTGEDLSAIPIMTKADLMANWDEIVTDRGLTLAKARAHLARSENGRQPDLLDGRYVVVRTGGSSGEEAVIVWHIDDFAGAVTANLRHVAWQQARTGREVTRIAMVTACNPAHTSAVIGRLLARSDSIVEVIAPDLPLASIVQRLNAFQPDAIAGYSSMLVLLSAEARAGRLCVDLAGLEASGESIRASELAAVSEAFDAPVFQGYGTTETGPIAVSNPPAPELHLFEDIVVWEPVVRESSAVEPMARGFRPAPAGHCSDTVLVTNVVNRLLPLIRYDLGDRVTMADGPNPGPFPGQRISRVVGRSGEEFDYSGGVRVPLTTLEPAFEHGADILQYQIRQTASGVDVSIVTRRDITVPLAGDLTARLREAGLAEPEVYVRSVDSIPRHLRTGKLVRYIPMAAAHRAEGNDPD